MKPLLSLLGLFLHVANTSPPILRKQEFYALKQGLLVRWGTADGYDIQHIKKECYGCKGTGIYDHDYYGEVTCNRCYEGVYQDAWIKLDRFKLGGYAFHCPTDRVDLKWSFGNDAKRWWLTVNGGLPRSTFEGYVSHRHYRYHLTDECAYWLFLIFLPLTFKAIFGHCGHCGWKWTPMVWLATLLFNFRMRLHKMNQWHLNPYDSDGNWERTIFGTCQVSEIESIENKLGVRRRMRRGLEDDIPF